MPKYIICEVYPLLMYGAYAYPFNLKANGIIIDVKQKDRIFTYTRECNGEEFGIKLSAAGGRIIINPVEPVNLPKKITHFLEIGFDKIVMPPESYETYYLKFPVEIGVFYSSRNDISVIDIFSLSPHKYSLYGTPKGGSIVKYCYSEIYSSIPETDPLREGIIALNIINNEKEIIEISKVVFDSFGMKIFYDSENVTMSASMKILPKYEADTEFINAPLIPGSGKSIELYTAMNIPVVKRNFKMEWGY